MEKPILLLLFNRPIETKILFDRLRLLKPSKIYINQDGPRINFLKDKILCQEVKKLIKDIDWQCDIKTKFSEINLGCRTSVSSAISWFFQNEEEGIILEDDCIPSKTFFLFCNQMLDRYKESNDIFSISGSNFQKKRIIGNGDYYFSKYAHCWGWATWKRAWRCYDNKMNFWSNLSKSNQWKNLNPNKYEKRYWSKIFDLVSSNKINSWAYVWLASIWNENGKSIIPNKNLIVNIGFNEKATNTVTSSNINIHEIEFEELENIINHPKNLDVNFEADKFVFENHFNGKYNFWPWRFFYILKLLLSDPKTFYLRIKKYL